MTTMTYRMYKDEFSNRVLNFVKEDARFTIVKESEKVLTILGDEKNLEKLMQCMYLSSEGAKKIFPEIITAREAEEIAKKMKEDILNEVRDNLIKMYNIGVHHTIEYSQLYNVWKNLK